MQHSGGLRSPAQKVYILHKKLSLSGALCAKPPARERWCSASAELRTGRAKKGCHRTGNLHAKRAPMPSIKIIAAFAALVGAITPATAQDWPTRPVTMVYPFAAGSAADVLGRLFASRLSEL